MTLKNLPQLIVMVALVIPLGLATPAKAEVARVAEKNCAIADDVTSAFSTPVSGDTFASVPGQIVPSAASELCEEPAPVLDKADFKAGLSAGVKQSKDACSISGQIYGIEGQTSRSIYVVVIDPNTENALARFQAYPNSPDRPNYEFSLMRPGRYLLSVFHDRAGTLVPFRTRPSERSVNCSRGSDLVDIDFELQ